jgi:hypothetical protein
MVKAQKKKRKSDGKEGDYEQITYDDYVKERELLSKIEQANYESYEKTILTLAAAFLAFSVSFLGIVRGKTTPGVELSPLQSLPLLISSWISFAASIFSLLMCFLINAMSLRSEVVELENLLEGKQASERINKWSIGGFILYIISGTAFIAGLVFLLMFCIRNIHKF